MPHVDTQPPYTLLPSWSLMLTPLTVLWETGGLGPGRGRRQKAGAGPHTVVGRVVAPSVRNARAPLAILLIYLPEFQLTLPQKPSVVLSLSYSL